MTERDLIELAYSMEKVYGNTRTSHDAVAILLEDYKEVDPTILYAMWHAVDAYAEANTY